MRTFVLEICFDMHARLILTFCVVISSLTLTSSHSVGKQPAAFHIQVVDSETRRGVPLVELRTVNDVKFITDSAGNIAIRDADLLDQQIYFHVSSHGYEFPEDGFGFRGFRVMTKPGGQKTVEIKRVNLAERIYRITGSGIYQHTRQLGLKPPAEIPAVNSQVVGCDSVVNAVYQDRLYWFWGDTNRFSYPLGNFQVTSATSAHPSDLDVDKGIQLEYFQNQSGFAKQMVPVKGSGPTWIFGAFVTKDQNGNERLVAKYEKIKAPLTPYQRGLALFSDKKKQFEKWIEFDLNERLYPDGQAFSRTEKGGKEWVYFATPFPLTRVLNQFDKIQSPSNYETYTYFKSGIGVKRKGQGELQVTADMLERDSKNRLVNGWKKNAQPITPKLERTLLQKGLIQRSEAITLLSEPSSDKESKQEKILQLASGSVAWNPFRNKWIMIAVQSWGSSMLGEIWYAESDRIEGPWKNPTKIVTHQNYSFYNPRHHSYFDTHGGRVIYFEGTYTKMFSGTKIGTPRYDYNQIMYKLDLSRMKLAEEQ